MSKFEVYRRIKKWAYEFQNSYSGRDNIEIRFLLDSINHPKLPGRQEMSDKFGELSFVFSNWHREAGVVDTLMKNIEPFLNDDFCLHVLDSVFRSV